MARLRGARSIVVAMGLWAVAGIEKSTAQEFEAGLLDVTQASAGDWHHIQFNQGFTAAPVVVLGPLSARNSQGATLRVRDVTSTGFEFQIDEWDYLDGSHPSEQVSFLALAEGTHTIGGLRWEAARLPAVNRQSSPATCEQSYSSSPLVLAQIEGEANPQSLAARVHDVSPSGYAISIGSEEANANLALNDETVATIAIQTGSGSLGDLSFQVGLVPSPVARSWSPLSFAAHASHPVLLAGIQTKNSPDPAVLRMRALSPAGVEFRCDEERSADNERSLPGEQVGYLAIAGQVVQGTEADARIEFGDV
ncbi:MAG: H-type lectin domain-containing protein, partial [Verrucomicrobiales bacterium]